MIDAKMESVLRDIVRREGRSLLQYVEEAYPWAGPDETAPLAQLRKLVADECEMIGRLIDLLARRCHSYPYLGSYPNWFTTINFISFDHLLPMLVDCEARSLGELECAIPEITDTEALGVVQELVDMKRRHLDLLKKMASAHPETVAASH
jgi:hypothetical protein